MATGRVVGLALYLVLGAIGCGCGAHEHAGVGGARTEDGEADKPKITVAQDAARDVPIEVGAAGTSDANVPPLRDSGSQEPMDSSTAQPDAGSMDAAAGADDAGVTDAGVMDAGAMEDAGDDCSERDAQAEACDGPRPLRRVFSQTAVTGLPGVAIAADGDERVYLIRRDLEGVKMIAGGQQSTYLTAGQLGTAVGRPDDPVSVMDIERAADGTLYVLTSFGTARSTAPGHAVMHSNMWGNAFSLLGPDRWVVAQANEVAVLAGNERTLLVPSRECVGELEDLAVAQSGNFVYQPGCNGHQIIHGSVSSATFALVWPAVRPADGSDLQNFLCSAPAPSGGFYLLLEFGQTNEAVRNIHLYKVAEDFDESHGFTEVQTAPSFVEAAGVAVDEGDSSLFFYCALAITPSGTIFIASDDQLWRIGVEDPCCAVAAR